VPWGTAGMYDGVESTHHILPQCVIFQSEQMLDNKGARLYCALVFTTAYILVLFLSDAPDLNPETLDKVAQTLHRMSHPEAQHILLCVYLLQLCRASGSLR
jgi:hypothetical protein